MQHEKMTLEKICELGLVFSGGEDEGGGGDTGYVGTDGTLNDGWAGRDEFKANEATLSRYKTVGSLAKGLIDTKSKLGKDPDLLVEIPTDTSSDEVKVAWRKARGVPDSVDGYEYALSDEMAVKIGPLDDKKMVAFRDFAHKQDWSPAQFRDALDFYHTNISGDIDLGQVAFEEQKKAAFDKGTAILNREWLDETTTRTAAAQEFLQKYGEIEVKGENGDMVNPLEMLFTESPELKTSPWLTMIADNMAQAMSEDTLKGRSTTGGLSLEGINTQITDLRSEQGIIRDANPVNFKSDAKFKDIERRLKLLYQKRPT